MASRSSREEAVERKAGEPDTESGTRKSPQTLLSMNSCRSTTEDGMGLCWGDAHELVLEADRFVRRIMKDAQAAGG